MPKTLPYVNHEVAHALMPEGREAYARVRRSLILDAEMQHDLSKYEDRHSTLRNALGTVASAHLADRMIPPLPEELGDAVLSLDEQNTTGGTRADVDIMHLVLEAVYEHGYRSDG